jgi:integrase
MSRQSSKSKPRRKPAKPKGFPLTAHPSGQWSKKVTLPSGKQMIFYFGVWADPEAALKRFNREWEYLKEGRTPPAIATGDGCTLKTLANAFLTAKQDKVDSGELSGHSFGDYRKTTDRLVAYFGKDRRIDDLRPDDFEGFRKSMAATLGVVALKNEINRARIVLKYAFDNRLIDRPVNFGQGFDKPAARVLRKAKHEAGPNLLEACEVRRILDAADPILQAMIYLAVNGGLGNTDVANLPKTAIDFAGGWLEYPRPKTQISRRIKLWPETCQALRVALQQRPEPKDQADADMVFLTIQKNRWVRCTPSRTTAGKFAVVDTISARFKSLLQKLGINGRRRLGFYTLRHCFETVAGETKDQVAVNHVMGHVDETMAGEYRERISDDRLQAVTECVRAWLFGVAPNKRTKGARPAARRPWPARKPSKPPSRPPRTIGYIGPCNAPGLRSQRRRARHGAVLNRFGIRRNSSLPKRASG